MKTSELTLYSQLLSDVRDRVRQAQQRAIQSVNAEMLLMYWDVGRMIAARQQQEGWGAKVIARLAVDLQNELPEEKGFSPANLKRMVRFWSEYPGLSAVGARPVRQIGVNDCSQPDSKSQKEISAPPVRQLPGSPADSPDELNRVMSLPRFPQNTVAGTFHVPFVRNGDSSKGQTGCVTRRVPATFSMPSCLRVSCLLIEGLAQ